MNNPLDAIKDEVQKAVNAAEVRIEIALHKEFVSLHLSRLIDLDPDHATEYRAALTGCHG
jgi:hypothetical protein